MIADALKQVQGAYCMLFLTKDSLIAARDPHGFRPLALGSTGTSWVIASETCSFDIIGAEYVRDVLPGEIVEINEAGLKIVLPVQGDQARLLHFRVYLLRATGFENLRRECRQDQTASRTLSGVTASG